MFIHYSIENEQNIQAIQDKLDLVLVFSKCEYLSIETNGSCSRRQS